MSASASTLAAISTTGNATTPSPATYQAIPGGRLRVAILGDGPAGATLAAFLAQAGHTVALFDRGERPSLIVGESLIPALIPIFRRLGIEERVAAIGLRKPGVSFLWPDIAPLHLTFDALRDPLPQYAYNVPRPAFDLLLVQRALEAGAKLIQADAKVERAGEGERLQLTAESLALAPCLEGRQPDLIVDASGRRRQVARLLDLPTRTGARKDVAYFAHYDGIDTASLPVGQVRTSILEAGWGWIIPLRDCQSLGAVLNQEHARPLGRTPEERLDAVVARDPHISAACRNAKRITEVLTYSNYQLITERTHGPNWVLLGDAFGFVDPMLSPGMFMAMHSAQMLFERLERGLAHPAVRRAGVGHTRMQDLFGDYDRQTTAWLQAWQDFIEYFYDGRIFALREAGDEWGMKYPGKMSNMINRHMNRWLASMASGSATRSRYGWMLLHMGEKYFHRGKQPAKYRVR